jgi:hypothetical protein
MPLPLMPVPLMQAPWAMRRRATVRFDLAMAFNARDMAKVNRMFAELLGGRQGKRQRTVQAKFYLSAKTYDRLRKQAAERGVKQSALVEGALQMALA